MARVGVVMAPVRLPLLVDGFLQPPPAFPIVVISRLLSLSLSLSIGIAIFVAGHDSFIPVTV